MPTYIWKQGFPTDTPEQQARVTALDAAAQHYRDLGHRPGAASAQIVRTEDHDAAGEYLVRVVGEYQEGEFG